LKLFLLRHAKSDWANEALDDHERPLNPRGLDAAPRMGAYMASHGYIPNLIFCSTARRALATLELVLPFLNPAPEVKILRALYLAERDTLLEQIRTAPPNARALMLVGHNPGMGDLAFSLSGPSQDEKEATRKARLADKFATAGLAVLAFDIAEWRSAHPGIAQLKDYTKPKDLPPTGTTGHPS
jgi:phosphohistidine phosphatase